MLLRTVFILSLFFGIFQQYAFSNKHPCVFVTSEEVAKIDKFADDPEFSHIKDNYIRAAERFDVEQLPEFESGWHKSEKDKPVAERNRAIARYHLRTVPLKYSNGALNCSRAWLLTNEKKYLKKAREVLLQLCDMPTGYGAFFYAVGIDFAVSHLPALEAYDIVYDNFTKEQKSKIDSYFDAVLTDIVKCDDYWIKYEPGTPINNHYAIHNHFIGAMGFFYNKPELVERAIYGDKAFKYMLKHGINDNAVWKEGSLPYGFVQMRAMLELAVLAKNSDYEVDLYRLKAAGNSLKSFYESSFDLFFPDGTLMPIGDGYGNLHNIAKYKEYDILYSVFEEDQYAWIVAKNEKRNNDALFNGVRKLRPNLVKKPSVLSKLWREHGMFSLRIDEGREYWDGNGWVVSGQFGDYVCHEHADKLSIMVYGGEKLWIRDSEAKNPLGSAPFVHTFNQDLNWTTVSHNTVMIDFKSQPKVIDEALRVCEFINTEEEKRITLADTKGILYNDVYQMRTLITTDRYILDVFQVESLSPHQILWIAHINSEMSESVSNGKWEEYELPEAKPWSFLKEAESIPSFTENTFYEKFNEGKSSFSYDIYSTANFTPIKVKYPKAENIQKDGYISMRMFLANAKSATFAVVYRKGTNISEPIEISADKIDQNYNVLFEINGKNFKHDIPLLSSFIGNKKGEE
jgi:hypothetical protein